jgi:hypothetical protein
MREREGGDVRGEVEGGEDGEGGGVAGRWEKGDYGRFRGGVEERWRTERGVKSLEEDVDECGVVLQAEQVQVVTAVAEALLKGKAAESAGKGRVEVRRRTRGEDRRTRAVLQRYVRRAD